MVCYLRAQQIPILHAVSKTNRLMNELKRSVSKGNHKNDIHSYLKYSIST